MPIAQILAGERCAVAIERTMRNALFPVLLGFVFVAR